MIECLYHKTPTGKGGPRYPFKERALTEEPEVCRMSTMEVISTETPSKDEKQWGVILHLSPLLGYLSVGIGFFAPLVIWLLKREESKFLEDQGKEVFNFVITYLIAGAFAGLLCFVLVGFLLLPVVGIAFLVLSIIGAIKASEGVWYRYPAILRLIK